ncbi:MAG: hypothetical protein QOI44_2595 [Actinomycetota bacterium]|jgi:hypothetical protein|nr:hypothetical protein [Actinomycetota bacterium]
MHARVTPVRRVWCLAVIGLVLLAGCKVDAHVDITLHADGTGTVSAKVALDADAVRRLTKHAPLDSAVPLDDLRDAGWRITAWKRDSSGGAEIALSRTFVNEEGLAHRLADLAGPSGALRDPRITRTRGWFGSSDKIAITVDLRDVGAGVKSDAELAQSLQAAGLDVNTLDAQLSSELKGALQVTVRVRTPDGRSQTVGFHGGGHATIVASQSQTYVRRMVLLAVGGVLLLLALIVTAALLRSRSRLRRTS